MKTVILEDGVGNPEGLIRKIAVDQERLYSGSGNALARLHVERGLHLHESRNTHRLWQPTRGFSPRKEVTQISDSLKLTHER